jgi:hypothetical protein
VNVTFARRLPDDIRKLQEQSFQHYSKKSHEEPWICTNYYSSNDSDDTRVEVDRRYNRETNINESMNVFWTKNVFDTLQYQIIKRFCEFYLPFDFLLISRCKMSNLISSGFVDTDGDVPPIDGRIGKPEFGPKELSGSIGTTVAC